MKAKQIFFIFCVIIAFILGGYFFQFVIITKENFIIDHRKNALRSLASEVDYYDLNPENIDKFWSKHRTAKSLLSKVYQVDEVSLNEFLLVYKNEKDAIIISEKNWTEDQHCYYKYYVDLSKSEYPVKILINKSPGSVLAR